MYGIYANIGGRLMGSMLPYIAAPWIRHGICEKWPEAGQPVNVRSVRSVEAQAQPNDYSTHDGSMVLLYMVCHGSHQYTPFMLVYIPAPWIRHGVDDNRFFCHQKSRKSHLVSNRITYLMTSAIYSAIVRPKLPGRGPYVPMFGTWFRAVAVAVVVGPLRPCLAEDDCLECEMKMLQLDAKVSEWKNGPTVGRNTVCGYTRYVTYCINYIYIYLKVICDCFICTVISFYHDCS